METKSLLKRHTHLLHVLGDKSECIVGKIEFVLIVAFHLTHIRLLSLEPDFGYSRVVNRVVHRVWMSSSFLNNDHTFNMSQILCLNTW